MPFATLDTSKYTLDGKQMSSEKCTVTEVFYKPFRISDIQDENFRIFYQITVI